MPTNTSPSVDWLSSMRQAAGLEAEPRTPERVPWERLETAHGRIEAQIVESRALPGRRLLVVEYPSELEGQLLDAVRGLAGT